jgi:uncharacterized protein YjiS (DUF1127 family)
MPEAIRPNTGMRSGAKRGAYDQFRSFTLKSMRFLAISVERARQRRALASLDDHMLRDIGITRSEAWQECAIPFWR